MIQFLLDNTFLILAPLIVGYFAYRLIFHVHTHDVEPEELAHAYFLLKRRWK